MIEMNKSILGDCREVMLQLKEAGSKVGDIVFDPFMGSGTVGRVAQALGRKWLGAELNPEYMKIQDNRTAQQSLELI